ncbi:MAG: hypothetical protein U0Q19_01670 [Kineosporiaceae bacterium]
MDHRTAAGSLLTLDEVRHRLATVGAELVRLERDATVFARAFHIRVAQAVYETLLEEEAHLAALPTLNLDDALEIAVVTTTFEGQPWSAGGPTRRREILEGP